SRATGASKLYSIARPPLQRRAQAQPSKGEIEPAPALVAVGHADAPVQGCDPAIEIDLGDGGEQRLVFPRAALKARQELLAGETRLVHAPGAETRSAGVSGATGWPATASLARTRKCFARSASPFLPAIAETSL